MPKRLSPFADSARHHPIHLLHQRLWRDLVTIWLLWAALMLPSNAIFAHKPLAMGSAALLLAITVWRLYSVLRIPQRLVKSPRLAARRLLAGIYMTALCWGLVGAWIFADSVFAPLQLPYVISASALCIASLGYFHYGVSAAQMFFLALLLPPLGASLLAEGFNRASAVALLVLALIGLQRVGQSLHRNYRRTQTYARLADERLEQLQNATELDPLTGVLNHPHFDLALKREWKRAHREQQPIALLMIDIDHLQRINDSLGHAAGNRALGAVADTVRSCALRESDVAARYGSDQFALLLPATAASGAQKVAERLLRKVATTHDDTLPRITVSIGIGALQPDQHDNCEVLIQSADHALAQAKRVGCDTYRINTLATSPLPHA